MKKISITAIAALAILCTGCYDDYIKDYDYSGAYLAYQYNLRTFVVGEGMRFEVGVVLGGVMDNKRDRTIGFSIDPTLVTADLSAFRPDLDDPGSFTAFDVMSGNSTNGSVSQPYVTDAVKASGITDLTPLPDSYFSLSNTSQMVIRAGRHTGTVTVKADSLAFLTDANTRQPYYAIAFRLGEQTDVDVVPVPMSFAVIAVRYENMLFGNYWHGGVTTVRNDATDAIVRQEVYPTEIPAKGNPVYTLTTVAPDALTTSNLGNGAGSLRLKLDGSAITVTSADGSKAIEPFKGGSLFNRAKLLQNRQLFLNYKFSNGDGTTTFIQDTLTFRNRVRDGVNEWQDENPENYK